MRRDPRWGGRRLCAGGADTSATASRTSEPSKKHDSRKTCNAEQGRARYGATTLKKKENDESQDKQRDGSF